MFDVSLYDNMKSDETNDPNSQAEDFEAVAEQFPILYNPTELTNPTLSR